MSLSRAGDIGGEVEKEKKRGRGVQIVVLA